MKKLIWVLVGLIAPLVSSAYATGPSFGSYDRTDNCFKRGLAPDEVIAACQNAILAGLLTRNSATAAYQNMGAAYVEKGDYPQALKAFDYAIKWTPSLWQAYVNRGYVYSQMGEFDSALSDLNKAIELKPDEPMVYVKRARAYERMSRPADAMADFDKALTLNPQYEPALRERGELKTSTGDTEGGNADLAAAKAAEAKATN